MLEPSILLPIALSIAAYALFSRRLTAEAVTAPMLFTAVGFGLFAIFGEILPMRAERDVLHGFAEITLVILLFSDAAQVRFGELKQSGRWAARLLFIALPLSILLGTLLARWVSPDQPWAVALLVAAILTPTDAALAQAFVESKRYPEQLRTTIGVESGLNDGLTLPLVITAAILAASSMADGSMGGLDDLPRLIGTQLLLGPLVGVGLGFGAAKLLDAADDRGWIAQAMCGPFFLACALASYWLAELIGGNGFIAAFVGGLAFGNTVRCRREFVREFMESEGQILIIATFTLFGAVMIPIALMHASWQTVALAIGFLTGVRILPAFLALTGTGLAARDKLMLGWFGPRGLASILFALFVMERYEIPGADEVLACTVLTVLLSIVLHGTSSSWLALLYPATQEEENSAQTGA